MGRPPVPLIDRATVIATALEIIDREGLDAFSIRRLASELGVNGASLYHHFEDKDAILHGIRLRIMREARFGETTSSECTWQQVVRDATLAYRHLLLRHPNFATLMAPNVLLRPFSLLIRERVAIALMEQDVPEDVAYAIIESVEMLAYSCGLLNPGSVSARGRLPIKVADNVPALARIVKAAPKSSDRLFAMQLDALIMGWTVLVRQSLEHTS